MIRPVFLSESLPAPLAPLLDLALDLRWTWSHEGDALWRSVDAVVWERTKNPWIVLQDLTEDRALQLARDEAFIEELGRIALRRSQYLDAPGWFGRMHEGCRFRRIAYFSMEFGLSEALPIYAGGLGVLAGDFLKGASDLGVPVVGVGLLYREGYFRQTLDASGRQQETYPYNDSVSLPIQPVQAPQGGWLRIPIEFPGRTVHLRVWKVVVGRVTLYLLDSNDPLNGPTDRGITSKLYGGGLENRLAQEIVLGIGGWKALEALQLEVDVCHLNEGHAAFLVVERARTFLKAQSLSFQEALWATRAGNVFTTHTPVPAGFDQFPPRLMEKYFPAFGGYLQDLGLVPEEFLALGRADPRDPKEPFNMAYLALRGSYASNAVSRLHGKVSRALFQRLYPRWPLAEVPITHVTNGVHVPSWDSVWSDEIWTRACGKGRWLGDVQALSDSIHCLTDEEIWKFHSMERDDLVRYSRKRLARQFAQRGAEPGTVAEAEHVLDPEALTLGFARRFSEYKRPTLILQDPERLARLLSDPRRPVQLIVAGKAHPDDVLGKHLIEAWGRFVCRPDVRHRVVFLEDYDISLTQVLVQGVDVWINVPRRPCEACGTSGMKVLVNGGLNLSVRDGWWAEAYVQEVGWAVGDDGDHAGPEQDADDARRIYELLEQEIVPEFYQRDGNGVPRRWVARMRASMSRLTPTYSANRMVREYVERMYAPACDALDRRRSQGGKLAATLDAWQRMLDRVWPHLRFGEVRTQERDGFFEFQVEVHLGGLDPCFVAVELWADHLPSGTSVRIPLQLSGKSPGSGRPHVYGGKAPAEIPADHYTPRVVPRHPEVRVPAEDCHILWEK